MTVDAAQPDAGRRAPRRSSLGFGGLVYVPIVISAFGLILTACGGSDTDAGLTWTVSAGAPAPTTTIENLPTDTTDTTTSSDATTPSSAPAQTAAPGTTPETTPETTPTGDPADNAEELELGQLVYEVTAGGVGCASCHGFDGRGSSQGPNIISLSRTSIAGALGGGVPDMDDINLSSEELDAVSAYLDTLTP